MRFNYLTTSLKTVFLVTSVLLFGAGQTVAQSVNLTAKASTITLPDGRIVPMWGYACGATTAGSVVTGVTITPGGAGSGYTGATAVFSGGGGAGATATVTLNTNGSIASINVTNGGENYTSAPTLTISSTTTPALAASFTVNLSTSGSPACTGLNGQTQLASWAPPLIKVATGSPLVINLANSLSFTPTGAATANSIPTSLMIVGQLGGGGGLGTTATSTPSPSHANAQQLTWPFADPATTGTPPPQLPRVRSFSTEVAAGGNATLTWAAPKAGTYLIESGTHPSIQGPMGLYGILVVTDATSQTAYPGVAATPTGAAIPAVSYGADIPLLLSEIDPVQNSTVSAAVNTASFDETTVWSGLPNQCGNKASASYLTCYPPAVNYSPLYYLINGVAFDKTHAAASLFAAAPATGATPDVLVRLVNAGLRMHVPSIIGAQTGATPVSGFGLIAEDGNQLPGVTRIQSEVFMAPGKTYDVKINVPTSAVALPIFDRQLSLSGNATARDSGMLAYISVNGAGLPAASGLGMATARDDSYPSVINCGAAPCKTVTVSDPGKGLIANDTNVFGVLFLSGATNGTLKLNGNGTFSYTPNVGQGSDSFMYCANGSVTGTTCSSAITATVTLAAAPIEGAGGITCIVPTPTYTSNVATSLIIKSPGVLSFCKDALGYPLTVNAASVQPSTGLTLSLDKSGAFNASVTKAGTYSFDFSPQNSQGTPGATATATLVFPIANGPTVQVLDGQDKVTDLSGDYRWIIEEDRTFYVNPNNTTNGCTPIPPATTCTNPTAGPGIVPTYGTNFHTSYMPLVAQGCVGKLSCESGQSVLGQPAFCDSASGICGTAASQKTEVLPTQVHLDPSKRYYLSILPGDGADALAGTAALGHAHGMGGAPLAPGQTTATVYVQPTPFPTAKLSIFVFEDDFPLNGEQDAGGGIDVLASNEPGLGGFEITLFDDAGGTGDATGQMTYDMFNQPLSNSLAGTIDPATGLDACPISAISSIGTVDSTTPDPAHPGQFLQVPDLTQTGITGTIVTCPRFEAGGVILSPLAGQAVVANMMPGRYGVVATPAADRIARGEEWLQTNTLDGQKAHDSFLRVGEPSFFQEFGPAGYHVSIGFANGTVINSRKAAICGGTDPVLTAKNCTNTVKGHISTNRMSRTPDERLYGSGTIDSFSFTQCYVSLGDTDGEDFAFTKCNNDGSFILTGIPTGNWRVTVFDQWNDMLVDGLSTPVGIGLAANQVVDMKEIAMNQWQANIYTRTFFDTDGSGVSSDSKPGLSLVSTNIRFRDGSFSNFNSTDLSGNAGFNEVFPLFNWYVVETTTTRYKNTGTHVVYDAGGPADTTCTGVTAPCGASVIGANMANTYEHTPLPFNLHVPGAVYCTTADCAGQSILDGPGTNTPASTPTSTGRIDPPWVQTEGWQGFSGQNSFIEFGKMPFAEGETGGIQGHVVYASTRPFDDPALLLQLSWEPLIPHVTINLYQETTAPDGSQALHLVDTTQTSGFDDWAQGFRSDGVPNMNCPGQFDGSGDTFFYTLYNQPMYLDLYNNGGTAAHTVPNNSQFKCYDGMHNWNQVEPAPYDGMYSFPSVLSLNPTTGTPAGTMCHMQTASEPWGCIPDPVSAVADPYRHGTPMLPAAEYVVEVVIPQGYELVKEEDKNILIGDTYIAPVTVQFPGVGGTIYILPDQAAVDAGYNANNPQNSTTNLGAAPRHEGDTGSIEEFWPCVGQARIIPDFISLFPVSQEVSPFAGATRNLCDRKQVTLSDQSSALAKFYLFTSTHAAAHFTGVITDDFTSEFDPFSPQFGEKFSPPNMPISIKDWSGTEISRIYSDQWGTYNGLTYSTWEVNPPNPTGYAPQMMVTCMNDPGSGPNPDPLYNPEYSNFCYEIPFMPGQTQYMDTPVVPTSAFAGAGYNNPDCALPAATPAISEVDGDRVGPWVAAGSGHTLTIQALGDQMVPNNAYSGPSATIAPYNQKTILRHYGFGGQGTVTIGGVSAPITRWSDSAITVSVPSATSGRGAVPPCTIQQQVIYGGTPAQCGELVVTNAAGQQSIDAITVTIGGKPPTHVAATASIQEAIDAAKPGDLLIIDPTCATTSGPTACTTAGATSHTAASHQELLLMWKPVRLQGVGASSSIVNGNAHPAGKLNPWRAKVNCLFGLALNGQPANPGASLFATTLDPLNGNNPYDPTGATTCGGWTEFKGGVNTPQVDRIPLEGIVGWDTTLNGNLAQLLQEPSLMGAYEGAAITVLGKGVKYPPGVNIFGTGQDTAAGSFTAHEGQFPVPTVELTLADCLDTTGLANPYPSSFQCNPSSIDGLSLTNSSQGGGGIFVHGWGNNLEISNNRIFNNTGTLTGGITVGQGESPDALLSGNGGDPLGYNGGTLAGFDQQPWTCLPGAVVSTNTTPFGWDQVVSPPGTVANQQLPYCYNTNVNVHHNEVTRNSSIGDELFSSTPAGAGGVTFCTGSDYYKFSYNWVCGNLSTGDGGGLAQLGYVWNGDIEHNEILFNQSTNPTVPTNGGGIAILGAAPDGAPNPPAAGVLECGSVTDVDCAPGLSDGTGPGLVVNANLIMGNSADSGSGGGIRFQSVTGTEPRFFPRSPQLWNTVEVTNNIITNNVAGWDGAGVSLQDALAIDLINNTIMHNDTTASSGVLFDTLGAPIASAPGTNCSQNGATASCPQPAGLVTMRNTPLLTASLTAPTVGTVICPIGHGTLTASCVHFSVPLLANDVFWQNRAYEIGVGALGTGTTNQQNVVTLHNAVFDGTIGPQAPSQASTGACPAASYWDIGVRGDTGPANHGGGLTLAPIASILSDITGYAGTAANPDLALDPGVNRQYCNGSRIPPEAGLGAGWQVPAGISDATVPNPIFNLTPAATVDEGNNWINLSWGPLSLTDPTGATLLGNYTPASSGSGTVDKIPFGTAAYFVAPTFDFFGTRRKGGITNIVTPIDIGAVEFTGANTSPALTNIVPNFGARGTSVAVTLDGANLAGATAINVSGGGIVVSGIASTATTVTATFTINPAALLTARNVSVVTPNGTSNNVAFTVVNPPAPALTSIVPNTGVLGTQVAVTLTGTNFTPAGTSIAISGSGITIAATPPLTVVDSSHITATLVISGTATISGRNVSVTTPGGSSSNVTFTVTGSTPIVTLTPAAGAAFGNVRTGLSNGAAPFQNFTLSNAGPGTFTIGAITINSAPTQTPAAFARVGGFGGNCGTVLNATSSCTIRVQFRPLTTGSFTGSVVVTGTAPGGVSDPVANSGAPLGGTGVLAVVGFSAPNPSLVTGTVTAHSGDVTVTNSGTGPLTLTANPTVAKAAFGLPGTFAIVAPASGTQCVSGLVVAASGGTCTIGVQYTPPATGTTAQRTAQSSATVRLADTGATNGTQTSAAFNAN